MYQLISISGGRLFATVQDEGETCSSSARLSVCSATLNMSTCQEHLCPRRYTKCQVLQAHREMAYHRLVDRAHDGAVADADPDPTHRSLVSTLMVVSVQEQCC